MEEGLHARAVPLLSSEIQHQRRAGAAGIRQTWLPVATVHQPDTPALALLLGRQREEDN